ncbi:hypothetical protein [Hymenobacter ruricola]|uniref:FecR protein domain-containing protein n=1 Tax=Hymenobacter ruricola TaxID=2791023 RepID=A0ABS0I0A4_9BACT|nr:hypothetical protein [Hymenobacter ruricola]MBF9220365.1 hypothetical protein [Hymenobacter ruricola]
MFPEDIDDLFREKLDGHATPPGDADALWARLQATPAEEPAAPAPDPRLDQLFQRTLSGHATPPRRELWERLEDEHLRPRQRRAAAWWPMAIAAAVALLLVAGGAGLWLGFPSGGPKTGAIASQGSTRGTTSPASVGNPAQTQSQTTIEPRENAAIAVTTPAAQPEKAQQSIFAESPQKKAATQATRPAALASTASKASQAASEPPLRHLKGTTRQPDAATEQAPLVAHATPPATPSAPARATDELQKAPEPAPVVAQTKPAPTPEIVRVGSSELITVDVRTGDATASRAAQTTSSAVASSEEPTERRRLGGRLLQQAGNLVRGERVSLAEAAGLPENVTVRASVGGRSISKSIQL